MDNRILNHKFHRWLVNAENFERDWRKRNQRNFDFYDGDQWTADEKETLINRGQQPASSPFGLEKCCYRFSFFWG